MREYVVYRHGSNPVNQSPDRGLPEKMPVARIRADSPEQACLLAQKEVTIQDDQFLSAEPADVVDAQVNNLDLKAEALGPE